MKNVFIPLVNVEELEPKYRKAWVKLKRLNVELGDYLEFGVSLGSSMACMSRVVKRGRIDGVRLLGFDSFEGMPQSAATEDFGIWKPGQFASSLEQSMQFLTRANVDWKRTRLVKGWFEKILNPETIRRYRLLKAGIIMIDCDLYSASKVALNFSLPLIIDHTIIFFDDWRDDINFGECRAYTEFLTENKHLKSEDFGTYKPTGRIFILTNTDNVGKDGSVTKKVKI